MYAYFSDLHVDLLCQALLQPGERRIGQTVGRCVPWWAFGLVNQTYLVIATDRRVILVEHRMAWLHQAMKLHGVESLPWASVQETRVTGLFGKKLRLRGQGLNAAPVTKKMRIPNPLFGLLAPMRGNVTGARTVASAFQASRGLGPAPEYASLGPASQTAPQLAPPQLVEQSAAAPMPQWQPPQNAPGYSSVPPQPPAPAYPAQPPAVPAQRGLAPTPPRLPRYPQ